MEKPNKYKCRVPPGVAEVAAEAETSDVPVFAEQGKPRGRKPARHKQGARAKAGKVKGSARKAKGSAKKAKGSAGSAKKEKRTKKGKTAKQNKKARTTRAQGSDGKDQRPSGVVSKRRKILRRKRPSSPDEEREPVGLKPPSHVRGNHVYSSAYRKEMAQSGDREQARAKAKEANQYFARTGLVTDLCGVFRALPRKGGRRARVVSYLSLAGGILGSERLRVACASLSIFDGQEGRVLAIKWVASARPVFSYSFWTV